MNFEDKQLEAFCLTNDSRLGEAARMLSDNVCRLGGAVRCSAYMTAQMLSDAAQMLSRLGGIYVSMRATYVQHTCSIRQHTAHASQMLSCRNIHVSHAER